MEELQAVMRPDPRTMLSTSAGRLDPSNAFRSVISSYSTHRPPGPTCVRPATSHTQWMTWRGDGVGLHRGR